MAAPPATRVQMQEIGQKRRHFLVQEFGSEAACWVHHGDDVLPSLMSMLLPLAHLD